MLRLSLLTAVFVLGMSTLNVMAADEKKADTKAADTKAADTKAEPPARGFLPANFKKLDLKQEQIQDIYKIQNKYYAKVAELKLQMEKLKDQEKDEIEKVLTPAQKDRLKDIKVGEKTETKPSEKKPDEKK